ncbi:MAG: PilZ domain-containing protein [Actinomycetota bacterium]|nr:PilZ domain-containing protein [Actinomycetota bacterium]
MGTRAGSETVALPGKGTPLFLVTAEETSLTSRLESVDGDTFSVVRPAELTGPLEEGAELDIFWAAPHSRVVVTCRLLDSGDDPSRWRFAPTGPARPDNRRQFPRGGAGAAVGLTAAGDGETKAGALLDISEGGLRCWIDPSLSFAEGDRVRATLWLGTGEVRLDSVVHAVRGTRPGDLGRHLILTFTPDHEAANLIRQYVKAWEIGERRRELRERPGTT